VVATVHDLHFLQPGGDNSPLGGGYLRWVFEHRLSSVAAVIAVSHRTAEALKEATGWDGEGGRGPLIRDIPHGVDDVFLRRGKAAGGKGERGRPPCGLPRQYGLYVGSRVARKNLGELAFAWRILLDLGCDLPLVLAGPTRWPGGREPSGFAELRRRRRLHEVGFVDDATLAELFRGSSVVVLPSADEGFGLPVAEAMACGACVVCSPHVGALDYVLPGSVSVFDQAGGAAALAEAIGKVVGDSRLRAGMSAKALRSAEGFSWAECARETVGVYREVLGG
jgi:alpha-1,3-rhamnosyl/mannosyltransferase